MQLLTSEVSALLHSSSLNCTYRQWTYIYIYRVGSTTIHCIACPGSWSWCECHGCDETGNTVPRAGLKPTSLAFQASVLPFHYVGFLISPHLSMQRHTSDVSANYYIYTYTYIYIYRYIYMQLYKCMYTYTHIGTIYTNLFSSLPDLEGACGLVEIKQSSGPMGSSKAFVVH